MFITFEGGEGCGKTSIINKLKGDLLKITNIPLIVARDPGGTTIANQIRTILLSSDNKEMSKETELLLYSASRAELVDKVIRPNLDNNIVLCDRFLDSTLVYQGYVRGFSQESIWVIHDELAISLTPDITYILDVDPEIGLKRSFSALKNSSINEQKWEEETLDTHKKIREGFLTLCKNYESLGRFKIIDANEPFDVVYDNIFEDIKEKLNGYNSNFRYMFGSNK